MGFAGIARVTEDSWVTCASKDTIPFGLSTGDTLDIENTMCNEVRKTSTPIFIDDVAKDPVYCSHPIPPMFGIVSYVSFPIYRKDGSFFGTLCAIDNKPAKVNTTEIKGTFQLFAELLSFHLEAVEEMETAAKTLKEEREMAELRDQFIAILGHDLKNPIATMRMSSDILLKMSKEDLTLRHAAMIKSTSFRMQTLIENILDFAKGRMGEGIILDRQSNNGSLENMLEQVIKEVKISAAEREILYNIDLSEEVYCDKDRIGQLFANLLSNANEHGDAHAPIEVAAETTKEHFELRVTNKGEKISGESQAHLFQPFYRDHKEVNKKGLGLGLFIASEIAKAHEGVLEVSSTEEETCFVLKIPLHKK